MVVIVSGTKLVCQQIDSSQVAAQLGPAGPRVAQNITFVQTHAVSSARECDANERIEPGWVATCICGLGKISVVLNARISQYQSLLASPVAEGSSNLV